MIKVYLHAAMLIKGIKRTLRRIPILKKIIAKTRKKEWAKTTSDYDLNIFNTRLRLLKEHQIDIKNKTIIDIGCGNNCAHAFEFLSSGAKEVILCELFASQYLTEEKIRSRLGLERKDFFDRFSKNLKIIDDSIENMISLPDNYADIIMSTSLLEHVYDTDRAFREMNRILRKNGFMLHSIDLRDHFFFSYPLHFLRYSPWWWKNFYTKPETFTNRHRMPHYLELAEKYDFKIIYQYTELTEHKTDRFGRHKYFTKYSEGENRVTHLKFFAQKV